MPFSEAPITIVDFSGQEYPFPTPFSHFGVGLPTPMVFPSINLTIKFSSESLPPHHSLSFKIDTPTVLGNYLYRRMILQISLPFLYQVFLRLGTLRNDSLSCLAEFSFSHVVYISVCFFLWFLIDCLRRSFLHPPFFTGRLPFCTNSDPRARLNCLSFFLFFVHTGIRRKDDPASRALSLRSNS